MTGLDGVVEPLASAVRAASAAIRQGAPGLDIVVTSGYRSPARQAQLAEAWDRGDRRGLTSRPAAHSRHTEGRAVDLAFRYRGVTVPVFATPRTYFAWLADFMARYGVRWGGRFKTPSPNHYEI